jgi:CBS domain-containing protein
MVRAGEIMTTPVVPLPPDTPTWEIAETLDRHRISALPIVDEAGVYLGRSVNPKP